MSFLAGVPGKLKTLQDNVTTLITNFTSTISGRIDTTVSSRAPSSTALSTVQWTNVRAALLDKLSGVDTVNANPVLDSPIAINTPIIVNALNIPLLGTSGLTVNAVNSASGYSTALNLTGRGVLSFLAVTHNVASGGNCGCRLTVDGVVLLDSTSILGSSQIAGVVLVGSAAVYDTNLAVITFDQVPFNVSLLVEFYVTTGLSTMSCYSRWRKSE